MPVCSELLTLLFCGNRFLHRTVQILVTIYIWNCGCLIPLNNIEQTATKTEQQKELPCSARSFAHPSNVRLVYLSPRRSGSAQTPILLCGVIAFVAVARSMP